MPVTTDNHSRPLFQYNQLLPAEAAQVKPPRDRITARYFIDNRKVYDAVEFDTHYDGLWFTDKNRKIAMQQVFSHVLIGDIWTTSE